MEHRRYWLINPPDGISAKVSSLASEVAEPRCESRSFWLQNHTLKPCSESLSHGWWKAMCQKNYFHASASLLRCKDHWRKWYIIKSQLSYMVSVTLLFQSLSSWNWLTIRSSKYRKGDSGKRKWLATRAWGVGVPAILTVSLKADLKYSYFSFLGLWASP